MISLIVGIITQLCVLFSVLYMFKTLEGGADREVCPWQNTGATRGVLIFSQGFDTMGGGARGSIKYRSSVVQFDELYPVLAGVPDHIIFGRSDRLDNILNGVDVVMYAGPSGVIDRFRRGNNFFSFTYPRSIMADEPFFKNDQFVFKAFHELLYTGVTNSTVRGLLAKNVLFVLYLTSVSLVNLKYAKNNSILSEHEFLLSQGILDVQGHIDYYYGDKETVFVTVPHWSISNDRNPIIRVWGRGSSNKFSSPVELVDVCPLLATLLGIQIPVESVGRLPLSYLNFSLMEEAKALACNSLQLHQRVFSPEDTKRSTSSIFNQINEHRYAEATDLSEHIIQISQSLRHTSQKCFDKTVFCLVVFSLVGWIFVLVTEPMVTFTGYLPLPTKPFIVIVALVVAVALCEFLYVTFAWSHPILYIVMMHLSLLPWFLLLTRYKIIWDWCLGHANIQTLLYICSMILLEEALLLSFEGGFLTAFIITLLGTLPLFPQFRKTPFIYSAGWFLCCGTIIGLLNFPKGLVKTQTKIINLAATFWLCYGQGSVFFFNMNYDSIISQIIVIYMSISTILANAFILLSSIPYHLYYISWSIFTVLILPIFGKSKVDHRLVHVSLSYGPPLLLLSKDIESLSFIFLMVFVICWVFLERSYMTTCDEHWCDVRRGGLLVLSCSIGYQLIGRMEDLSPSSLLTPLLPLHLYWNNPIPYYAALFFKYLTMFTIVLTVYVSLILRKWKADMGFAYGLLLIEMICLRFLVQFLFANINLSEVISKHIFINMFAISFMLAYWLGHIYSSKYKKKKEIIESNELILVQTTTASVQ